MFFAEGGVARIPEAEVERLKAEVAGVGLRKTGSDLTGCCPFHEDSSPSLVISPARNLWHCLGACQAGGSVVDWVMRAEGVSFRHAVELLRDGMPAVTAAGRPPGRSTVRRSWPRRWSGTRLMASRWARSRTTTGGC
jgi:DNA primase